MVAGILINPEKGNLEKSCRKPHTRYRTELKFKSNNYTTNRAPFSDVFNVF